MSLTPLTEIIKLVDRSVFHSIRQEIVDKGFIPDILETVDVPVVSVITGIGGTFEIGPGDFTTEYAALRTFDMTNSTGNDGTYTVASVSFGGTNKRVFVNTPRKVVGDVTLDISF